MGFSPRYAPGVRGRRMNSPGDRSVRPCNGRCSGSPGAVRLNKHPRATRPRGEWKRERAAYTFCGTTGRLRHQPYQREPAGDGGRQHARRSRGTAREPVRAFRLAVRVFPRTPLPRRHGRHRRRALAAGRAAGGQPVARTRVRAGILLLPVRRAVSGVWTCWASTVPGSNSAARGATPARAGWTTCRFEPSRRAAPGRGERERGRAAGGAVVHDPAPARGGDGGDAPGDAARAGGVSSRSRVRGCGRRSRCGSCGGWRT